MNWTMWDDSVSIVSKGMRVDTNLIGMTTVPLPTLSSSPPIWEREEVSDQKTEFQGLVFVSLSNDTSSEVDEGEDQETKPHSFSDERVGAIQVFRDTCKFKISSCVLADGVREDWVRGELSHTLGNLPD